jgi:Zn-dependent peptidase ImmA (M78 family)
LQSEFKLKVVWLILNGKPEEALTLLAENYKVTLPKLKVGLPKGHKGTAYGCYTPRNETISVLNSDAMRNPFVILHEFYHHLRTSVDMQHRGTEKNANKFALEFINAYKSAVAFGN